jgi:hypothetical protein
MREFANTSRAKCRTAHVDDAPGETGPRRRFPDCDKEPADGRGPRHCGGGLLVVWIIVQPQNRSFAEFALVLCPLSEESSSKPPRT